MILLIILAHDKLGEALSQTAEKILGEQKGVLYLSSGNLGPVVLYKEVKSFITRHSTSQCGIIIAVDLKGGNTWNIACKIAHESDNIEVISGINLGMLLSFFTKRQNFSVKEMADLLIEDGHRNIERFKKF